MYRQAETALDELTFFEAQATDAESVRTAGPAIGPIHTGVIPPSPALRPGVPGSAVLSPLAIAPRGLHAAPLRKHKVLQVIVHNTGSTPAADSIKSGYRRPAIAYALDTYMKPGGIGPHYVIDFNGTVYAIVDERRVAWHAGWGKEGGSIFKDPAWRAPDWWLAAWGKYGFTSPLQLLPAGTSGPNSASIGIELLITTKRQYTDEQYRALARLITDIEKRHALPIPSAPGLRLLGHEDYSPHKRHDSGGGWDPGAHRKNPFFSWSRLWSSMRAGGTAPAATTSPSAFTPPANPQTFRKFRLTTYLVADQRELPAGAVAVPIYDNSGKKIAEGSPAFFAQLSLEGSGRLTDGRLINVTGKKVAVSHADYAGVLAYHRQAYANREKTLGKPTPTLYSGIVVSGGRVTHALAFHEVPAANHGIGYGMLRGIALVPFRTLAADIGRTQKSDPRWKDKGGLVPPGTRVYIKEYVGVKLPDGTTHDGWFVVNDTGGAIFGAHFDVFVGSRALSRQVTLPAFGQVWFEGIEQRIPVGYSYGLKP